MAETKAKDVYGQALSDYLKGTYEAPLLLHNNYGETEEMPIEVFFREENDLSDLESYALKLCEGRILDLGAGAGAHSLLLQNSNFDVVALDSSALACDVMHERGVKNVVSGKVMEYQGPACFDTLLMLMNGTGVTGTISEFKAFLNHAKTLLSINGKIIIDSSDIDYLYEGRDYPDFYYGHVQYQYEYKAIKGEVFPWLYLDQDTLQRIARGAGWHAHIVFEGMEDEFLAVLKPSKPLIPNI